MRNRSRLPLVGLLLVAAAQSACRDAQAYRTQRQDAEPLHAAVQSLTDVIVYDIFSPPQSARIYAYASVAAYEVLQQRDSAHRSLAGQLHGLTPVPAAPPDSTYYAPLASVHAFLTVGKAMTFSQARMDSLRLAIDERIRRTGVPEPVYRASLAYGERVAAHVLAWSRLDGYLETRGMEKLSITAEAGRWVPTPPAYMDAVEPNWARVRPFVLDSASQFRPAPPLPFDTAAASPYMREVREVYETGRTLTEEQRQIAAFWDCNPYVMHVQGHSMFATKKISPGGHWMGIVGLAARRAKADLMSSAEAYVRAAIAISDGFISVWDEKYRSVAIRPETVINAYLDESWAPLLQTPPFPEYTSGHSVISTAAAVVLTDQYGPRFAFADSAEVKYGMPVRSFSSFDHAAAEAAISRLYGGIHYRRAIEEGARQGRRVGQLVVRRVRTRAAQSLALAPAAARRP